MERTLVQNVVKVILCCKKLLELYWDVFSSGILFVCVGGSRLTEIYRGNSYTKF